MKACHQSAVTARFCLRVILITAVLWSARVAPAGAQDVRIRFEHVEEAHGLSHQVVTSLHQDRKGFLWIGTADGLNRYDGYGIRIFRHVPGDLRSIPSNSILAITEDPEGRIYVALNTGQVVRYDDRTGGFSVVFETPQEGHARSIMAVTFDRTGHLWAAALSSGVFRIDTASGTYEAFRHDPEDPHSLSHDTVFRIAEDDRGALWFGTIGGGVNRLDTGSLRMTRIRSATQAEDIIWSLYPDGRGAMWVGTQAGVRVLDLAEDPAEAALLPVPGALMTLGASAVLEDRQGNVWFGTSDGLLRYDPVSGSIQRYVHSEDDPFSLAENAVSSLLEDRSGNVWIGTSGGGLSKFSPGRHKFDWLRDPPGELRSVAAIFEDPFGAVWAGTWRGGLFRYEPEAGRWTHYHAGSLQSGLLSDEVTAIRPDPSGNLWVGTAGAGIHYFDRRAGRFYPVATQGSLHHRVFALEAGADGTLWIGTYGGGLSRATLEGFEGRAPRLRIDTFTYDPGDPSSLSSSYVTGLTSDADGNIWVGTTAGLNRVVQGDGAGIAFQRYGQEAVSTVIAAAGGRVWFGNETGLYRLDPGENRAAERHPVPGNDGIPVLSLVEDGAGRLWIASHHGLIRLDLETAAVRIFDLSDGLPSNHFIMDAAHRSADGSLYFGNRRGLVRFHPDRLPSNEKPPPLVLTALSVLDVPYPDAVWMEEGTGLRLSHRQNFFSIEFAALDYTAPERNRYRYILHGYDPGWVEAAGRPAARYTRVPPGRYVFQVTGSNNDGLWNEAGLSLPITITPAFWQTWWFHLLVVAAFAGAMAGLHRYRVARIREIERMRFRIAGDLHDDIGADLGSIALMSDLIQRRSALSEEDRRKVEQIGEAAREMSANLREIVWLVNPDHDSAGDLAARMQRVAASLLSGVRYRFDVELLSADDRLEMGLRRDLLLLFKEMVHNAARHSGADEIRIVLRESADRYELEISDDGCGFDPDGSSDGIGLENMRRRAAGLKGSVSIDSQAGRGTTIRLEVPK